MAQFLTFNRGRVATHELAARTLGDYIREVGKFVAFMKPATPVAGCDPNTSRRT